MGLFGGGEQGACGEVGGEAFGEGPGYDCAGGEDEDVADFGVVEVAGGGVGGAVDGGDGDLDVDDLRVEACIERVGLVAFAAEYLYHLCQVKAFGNCEGCD